MVVPSGLEPVAEQRPTFKSEAELVAIKVVVTDKQGRTLTNLSEGTFQVSEDHRPQRITKTHPADGKFHKLQVTVRGCDCHARARAGFVHSR
jgi:hypothetical protein